jgi:cephalosporin hydroxylase
MASRFQRTFRYFYYYAALIKMRRFPAASSAQALVDFIYGDCWELFKPGQIKEEVVELAALLLERRPKVIIEIGTGRSGGMLFVYSRTAAPDAVIISVDLPGGEFGDSYPAHKVPIFERIALPGQKIHLIRADSHDPATLEKVKKLLNGRSADFLFIDGDHVYDGVKADLEMYSPLVNEAGLVALQDIVPCKHPDCHVEDYWKDLKARYPHREIVKSWQQRWAGIGLIEKKALAAPASARSA